MRAFMMLMTLFGLVSEAMALDPKEVEAAAKALNTEAERLRTEASKIESEYNHKKEQEKALATACRSLLNAEEKRRVNAEDYKKKARQIANEELVADQRRKLAAYPDEGPLLQQVKAAEFSDNDDYQRQAAIIRECRALLATHPELESQKPPIRDFDTPAPNPVPPGKSP